MFWYKGLSWVFCNLRNIAQINITITKVVKIVTSIADAFTSIDCCLSSSQTVIRLFGPKKISLILNIILKMNSKFCAVLRWKNVKAIFLFAHDCFLVNWATIPVSKKIKTCWKYLILSTARWNILGYFAVVIINFLIDFPDHKLAHTKIIYVLILSKVGTGFDPCKCEFCMMLILLIFAIQGIVAPLFETSQHLYAIFRG